MADARSTSFYQQTQQTPFIFNSYPGQLPNNSQQSQQQQQQQQQLQLQNNNSNSNNSNLLSTLQSQLRTTGQVNVDLLRQRTNSQNNNMNGSNVLGMGRNSTAILPGSMVGLNNTSTTSSSNSGSNTPIWGSVAGAGGVESSSYQTIASATDSINSAANALMNHRSIKRRKSTPPTNNISSKESSPQVEEKPLIITKGKRGRKKKVTPDEIESDDEEDDQGPTKKGRRPSLNANEKRKLQNRAAQRAFRERKEKRVTDLEDKVAAQVDQLENFRTMMQGLQKENEALRRGEKLPPSTFKLPPPLEHLHESPHDTGASSGSEHDQLHVSPPQRLSPVPPPAPLISRSRRNLPESLPNLSLANMNTIVPLPLPLPLPISLPTYSYAHTTEPRTATSEATITSTLTLARTPISMERGAQTPDDGFKMYNSSSNTNNQPTRSQSLSQQQFNAQITERQQQQNFTLASPYPTSSSRPDLGDDMNFNFDFDLPLTFDSSSVPLPPLFQELFDSAFPSTPAAGPTSTSTSTTQSPAFSSSTISHPVSTEASEVGANDDCDEPPPLPDGKIPCATCDFSVVSCELPTPWRPPTIEDDKDTWVCQMAWSKLISHPMFSKDLVDELCRDLKDKAKCSSSGNIVILKSDVCAVFRSIPSRVMAQRALK